MYACGHGLSTIATDGFQQAWRVDIAENTIWGRGWIAGFSKRPISARGPSIRRNAARANNPPGKTVPLIKLMLAQERVRRRPNGYDHCIVMKKQALRDAADQDARAVEREHGENALARKPLSSRNRLQRVPCHFHQTGRLLNPRQSANEFACPWIEFLQNSQLNSRLPSSRHTRRRRDVDGHISRQFSAK
jgi:hypothetical protein